MGEGYFVLRVSSKANSGLALSSRKPFTCRKFSMDIQSGVPETSSQSSRHSGMAARIVVLLVLGVCAGLVIHFWPNIVASYYQPATAASQLKTGGTSAILVLAENFWKGKYLKEKGVELNFESVGSAPATAGMLDNVYAIAFTHAPASADLCEKAKSSGREIVHVPLMLCGVAPAYHVSELKGEKPLNFTGEVLAGIFLGKIEKWDAPALKAINPGVKLPAKNIVVLHRDDFSGTTQIFTEYLAAVSPEWQKQIGPGSQKAKWPIGVGANRNQGMAIAIHSTDGSIGYVDRMFVTLQDITLDYGAVQNHDKNAFLRAEPAYSTAALQATLDKVPDDLTFDLTDKPGKDSYPIAGVIYGLCSNVQPEGKEDSVKWSTSSAGPYMRVRRTSPGVSFAPLPP